MTRRSRSKSSIFPRSCGPGSAALSKPKQRAPACLVVDRDVTANRQMVRGYLFGFASGPAVGDSPP